MGIAPAQQAVVQTRPLRLVLQVLGGRAKAGKLGQQLGLAGLQRFKVFEFLVL